MDAAIYDFFLSYKRKDTQDFVKELESCLINAGYNVWLDSVSILPGQSIVKEIEDGMKASLLFILVLSKNYFEGWSEMERRNILSFVEANSGKIIPLWYDVDAKFVRNAAPLLSDINAITVTSSDPDTVKKACDELSRVLGPKELRNKMADFLFFRLFEKFPDDPNIKIFIAVITNNTQLLQQAIDEGANVNITDRKVFVDHLEAIREDDAMRAVFARLLVYDEQNGHSWF